MIKSGTKIKLYPWKTYRDDPTKSVPIAIVEDKHGRRVMCQALDINLYAASTTKKSSRRTGFLYLNIYTNADLTIGEYVTVDQIVSIQSIFIGRTRIFIATITIKEQDRSIPEILDDGVIVEDCLVTF
ncbi:hypothetical protein [Holdemania sp. Marseille-P2844]|jgi:hypothetical protein|uniref:hypothetical protein n=1 Tax=Holdemania sp. Marseille-P2844 TaxID=1852366 RepID=UPI000933145B|nr:hypothetical protein [Holdemania sp. Marseille-P2844]